MEYGIILFDSTHAAMNAEKVLLKEHKQPVRIITTPPKVRATCGFALRYDINSEQEIFELIKKTDLNYEGIVHASGKGLNLSYQQITID